MPINQTQSAMVLLLFIALLGLFFQLNSQQDKGAHDQNHGLRATNRQLQGAAQCSPTYTAVPGLSPGSNVGRIDGLATMDDCMSECCSNDRCEAIVWQPARYPTRCYMLNRSYESNYRSNSNSFVANKSSAVPSTSQPTPSPSNSPTGMPSHGRTHAPTNSPTFSPSSTPSESPTPSLTEDPTMVPSALPSSTPTSVPTPRPSQEPTHAPSAAPSQTPANTPTFVPTTSDEGLVAKEALYNEVGLHCDDYSDDAFHTSCSCQQRWCNSISPDSTCSATQEGTVCECDVGYLGARCEQEDTEYVESQKQLLNDASISCQNYNEGWFHTCSCDDGYCAPGGTDHVC
ncbi:Rhs element vgr protein [Seminavis robusta]|uniref:Rhs element vgr protein n=1 Tax=Seminavis robusta TaxID=568900 RepID=A0A9N8HAI2_9STRA|nr:Rhs element vgr protein [Seminavis robusta]|eukprot:Sro226_g092020.1 Rhs element vgr protein (344) ;mRNA; f:33744-34775